MTLGAICALCGEKMPYDEALGVALYPSGNPEASQTWLAHPLCVRGMLSEEALTSVRPELAELLGTEASEVEPTKLDHIMAYAIDAFGSARVEEGELDDEQTFVVVPGDISNDRHWSRLLDLQQTLIEENLVDPQVCVVLRLDG